MSTLHNHRLTTNFSFSKVLEVPAWNVPTIERAAHSSTVSVHSVSSRASSTTKTTRRKVERAEPCFITKRPSFANEQAHLVNAVRKDSQRKKNIENHLRDLGVVPEEFDLNDASNLVHLEPALHSFLDRYAFFAVTCCKDPLDSLINILTRENAKVQKAFDDDSAYDRDLSLYASPVIDARYELLVLHPAHMLPQGSSLTIYSDPKPDHNGLLRLDTRRLYVAAKDGVLRQEPGDVTCNRLPPFSHWHRTESPALNPFLVLLNADIKLRRFERVNNASQLLTSHDCQLLEKTRKIIDLIYWVPSKQDRVKNAMDVDEADIGKTVRGPVASGSTPSQIRGRLPNWGEWA